MAARRNSNTAGNSTAEPGREAIPRHPLPHELASVQSQSICQLPVLFVSPSSSIYTLNLSELFFLTIAFLKARSIARTLRLVIIEAGLAALRRSNRSNKSNTVLTSQIAYPSVYSSAICGRSFCSGLRQRFLSIPSADPEGHRFG
jgi:hypothetical protein